MRTILSIYLAVALTASLASQSEAATASRAPGVTSVADGGDYDNPSFGSKRWWEQQEDRGS